MGDDVNGTTEGMETHGGNETSETDVDKREINDDPKIDKLVVMYPKMLKMGQRKEQMKTITVMKSMSWDQGVSVGMGWDLDLEKEMIVMIMIQVETKVTIANQQFLKLLKLLD